MKLTALIVLFLSLSSNASAESCLEDLEAKLCLGNAPYKNADDFANQIEFSIANQNRDCGHVSEQIINKFKQAVSYIPEKLHPFFLLN